MSSKGRGGRRRPSAREQLERAEEQGRSNRGRRRRRGRKRTWGADSRCRRTSWRQRQRQAAAATAAATARVIARWPPAAAWRLGCAQHWGGDWGRSGCAGTHAVGGACGTAGGGACGRRPREAARHSAPGEGAETDPDGSGGGGCSGKDYLFCSPAMGRCGRQAVGRLEPVEAEGAVAVAASRGVCRWAHVADRCGRKRRWQRRQTAAWFVCACLHYHVASVLAGAMWASGLRAR